MNTTTRSSRSVRRRRTVLRACAAPLPVVAALLALTLAVAAFGQASAFSGKVVDPKGKGVEGATVTLTKKDDPAVTASTTSDKKGGFKLSIEGSGEFVLRAEKSGFGPNERSAVVEPGMQFNDVNLQLVDEAVWKQQQAVEAFNAGVQALQSGKEEEAAESFDQALAFNPTLVQAHYAKAAALHGLKRWEDAADSIEQYMTATPADTRPELYQLAFEIYFEGGQASKAEQMLAQITDPAARAQLAPQIYNAGVERNRKQDPDGAIAMFAKAAELDPAFFQAHQNIAAIEFNRRNWKGALDHLEPLLASKPDSVEGLRMRFFCYRALGDAHLEDALGAYLAKAPAKAAEEVADIAGDDFDAGQAALAIPTLEALVAVKPEVAIAHYHLGRALASKGDNAGAKTHLQHFLEMAPGHADAAAAKAMMAEL